ncbi:TPA: IS21 family transposase [Legionella anisa]
MPTERLTMRKIRDVLKLHYEQKYSNREVGRSLGISPGTVASYLSRAKAAQIAWPLPDDLDEDRLYQRLFQPASEAGEVQRPLPDMVKINQELKRKGVTLLLLWYDYKSRHPDGYGYSRYCDLYRQFTGKLNPGMRLTHKAGEKLFVDYSGLTVAWVDKETGVINQAQIFVAVLGASNYTFVEASAEQSLPCWILSHIHAFEYFSGVATCLVPDNLKAGITKPHLYDPDTNLTYQEMANHYSAAIMPARVRTPKDKSKVEVGVQGIQRWVLAPLRDVTFFSVTEINDAIAPLLKAYNERPFHELLGCRYSQFLEIDKPALRPLPLTRYQYATWKKARAGIDYHVAVDKHYYSIPWRYLKEEIDVRVSGATIECFYKGDRIALHRRALKPGHTTLHEHMPTSHQEYTEWTPERLCAWGKSIGENTSKLIGEVINSQKIPEQSYRACLGILRMGKRYGNARLENAAIRALHIGAYRYKSIESILKNGLDKQPLPMPASESTAAVTATNHDNVRGASYFH